MPNFRVTLPDGRAIILRGVPDAGTAQREAQGWAQANPAHDNLPGQFARGMVSGIGGLLDTASNLTDPARGLMNAFAAHNPAASRALYGRSTPPDQRAVASVPGVAQYADKQPVTEAGRIVRTTGEFAPNALVPGGEGGLVAQAGRVVVPALASEGARAATQALGGGQTAQNVASTAGAVLGSPDLAAGGFNAAKRAVLGRPQAVTQPIQDLANAAIEKHGIPLRSDQIAAAGAAGDSSAGVRDSNLAQTDPRFRASNLAQRQAFTNAVGRTFGAAGPLTTETMAAAKAKLSQGFQAHAAQTGVAADDQLMSDLASVGSQAREIGLSDNEVAAIDKQVAKVTDLAASHGDSGVIPGDAYQAITQKGSALDNIIGSGHGAFATQGKAIRTALSDAAARAGGPEAAANLADLRSQWANMKTVEPLAEKAGPEGLINPSLLQGRVNATFNNAAYGSGGDLKELGDIGQTFLKAPADSKTTARAADRLGPVKIGATAMGLLGDGYLAAHNPALAVGPAAAAVGAYGVGKAAQALKAARSNNAFATADLLNQSPPISITSLQLPNALTPGLIAAGDSQPYSGQAPQQ